MPKLRKNIEKTFKNKIIGSFIISDYFIKNSLLKLFQLLLFNNKNLLKVKKILIFRTGSLGDSVCALPAIYSIRKNFPDAQIDILTNAGAENLVSLGALIDKTFVNEVINYFGLEKKLLFKNLKERHYDLFIQLPQYGAAWFRQIRDIFIAKSLGVKYAFGWQIGSTRFLAKYQEKLLKFENERDRLLGILEKNGLKSYGLVFPLGITEEIKSRIAEIMKMRRLEDKDLNFGIVVGAKRQQNRWPIEYFKEVADYLLQKGFNILLFGGNDDIERAEQIAGENVFNFCGKLAPLETAEMMKYCRLVISNDTGPMHLSYAIGTPVIAIFSGRDYAGKWFPPEDEKNFVFRNYDTSCANCFSDECKTNKCLKEIKTQKIIDEIQKRSLNEIKEQIKRTKRGFNI